MRISKIAGAAAILLALAAFGPSGAKADVTYYYTGNDFINIYNSPDPTAPYTTNDFVSGTVVLSAPLGDSFTGYLAPVSFSFSDGVQTLTNTSPSSTSPSFYFSTSSTGAIVDWDIAVSGEGTDFIITDGYGSDQGIYDNGFDQAYNFGPVGVWTTPEPMSLAILGVGLLGLIVVGMSKNGRPTNVA